MHISISKFVQSKYILIAICLLAALINFYKISSVPPSLSWDEASVGYDAWSLTQDGKDQWGKSFPYIFQSFGEYKYPTHIYFTALSVKLFGLSDFSVRLPSAFMGIIDILLLFLLVKKITSGNTFAAISSAFFFIISPWHIQFSRVNWETNFALLPFIIGLIFFLYSFRKPYILILAYLLFGISLYTYNAAKVFIPIFVLLLTIIYKLELWKIKKYFFVGLIIFLFFFFGSILNPEISGTVRLKQVVITKEQIFSTQLFQLTKNKYIGAGEVILKQYLSHFSPQFLFISGDKNPRHSIQEFGELLYFDIIFIPIGLIYLLRLKQNWSTLILLWFFLGPLPASLFKESPHASRAMFSLGGWQIVSAFGFYSLYNICKTNFNKFFWGVSLIIFFVLTYLYIRSYFLSYPLLYSQDWQYGYKKLFASYKDQFKNYDKIIISDAYGQPYIFALYYLKYDPQKFRSEVKYNPIDNWGFSTVQEFGKFTFSSENKIKPEQNKKTLVFSSKNEKILGFDPVGEIYFLNGKVAFWIFSKLKVKNEH